MCPSIYMLWETQFSRVEKHTRNSEFTTRYQGQGYFHLKNTTSASTEMYQLKQLPTKSEHEEQGPPQIEGFKPAVPPPGETVPIHQEGWGHLYPFCRNLPLCRNEHKIRKATEAGNKHYCTQWQRQCFARVEIMGTCLPKGLAYTYLIKIPLHKLFKS